MSVGTIQDAAASAGLVVGVSMVSTLLAGDWATISSPSRHYFSAYLTTRDWHQDSVQYALLGHNEWSTCW